MNDRYLYRANRTDNGEWVEGCLLVLDDETYRIATSCLQGNEEHLLQVCAYEVDPSTTCQCTGLKEKNGNLIWENDVVGFWDTYSTENGRAEMDCIGKVVWDNETMAFVVTNRLSAESYEVLDECSVIGNIFDNPESLESEG